MSKGRIGFVGIGRMGFPMSGRLMADGYEVVAYDVDEAALGAIVNKGAKRAKSPRDVAAQTEIVLVSLPRPEVVDLVALGAEGVADGGACKVFVDLSTTGPRKAADIARRLAEKGIRSVDAPVSGGVRGAERGTLAVMLAGSKADCDRLWPMMEVIGRPFYIGPEPGQGQMMKVVNNLLSATVTAATCEAVALGVKAGLDPHIMVDVINAGSGRSTASEDKFPRAILPRTFDIGFAMGLMTKDVNLCLAEAEAMSCPMWIGRAVQQMWLLSLSQQGPDADMTAVMRTAEQLAGVTVGGKPQTAKG